MAFTKFVGTNDKITLSREEISKYPYLMLIKLGKEYCVGSCEIEIIKLHLERLSDYIAVIVTDNDTEKVSEHLAPIISDFSVDGCDSFVGVAILDSIDSKTGKIQLVTKELPAPSGNGKTAIALLGKTISHVVNVTIPASDKKAFISHFTLDRLLKIISLAL